MLRLLIREVDEEFVCQNYNLLLVLLKTLQYKIDHYSDHFK